MTPLVYIGMGLGGERRERNGLVASEIWRFGFSIDIIS